MSPQHAARFVLATLLAGSACAWAAEPDESEISGTDTYALDSTPRVVSPLGKIVCPTVAMVRYAGDTIRYHKPIRVYVGFRDRLRKFEKVVSEVAIEVYGRAPNRIRHMGTYNCRRIRKWPTYLSEHGLGNGIDIEGFDFGPANRKQRKNLPPNLRRRFQVRVQKHWAADNGIGKKHKIFLRALTERLVKRDDIFRILLGPAYPGHHNHFHFDCAPWRMVEL